MKLATLFSGIGAPEYAAQRVYKKVKTVFACEFDKFARQSYLANHKIKEKHFHVDVHNLDATKYEGKVDALVGGSPCQSFSIAGLRKGTEDERGQLIYQYIRVVEECKPEVIVYENVKGFKSIDKGETFKEFCKALEEIGYYIKHQVLNTKHYGVPQNRERVYIVGFRKKKHWEKFEFAEPIELTKTLGDVLEDDVDEKYYLSDKLIAGFERKKERGGIVGKLGEDLSGVCGCLTARYHKMSASDSYVIGAIRGRNPDNPTSRVAGLPTVQMLELNKKGTSNALTTVQKDNVVVGPNRLRKLTPRECLRLQDFPDSFNIVVSNTQAYKQAGNAMSVNVVEMIFRQIKKAMK